MKSLRWLPVLYRVMSKQPAYLPSVLIPVKKHIPLRKFSSDFICFYREIGTRDFTVAAPTLLDLGQSLLTRHSCSIKLPTTGILFTVITID